MPHQPDPEHSDLIDQAALPRLDLTSMSLSAVFVGGALGTVARYLVASAIDTTPDRFPWATLLINLSGSLLIGLIIPMTERLEARHPHARPLLVIGLLGGWTTYSALAGDAVGLAQRGHVGLMLTYLAATVVGGVAAVIAGNAIGRRTTH